MKFKKKKITILLILIFFFSIFLINKENLVNKLSQNLLLKNFYKNLLKKVSDISISYDKNYEKILLRFSEKHQNHWTVEDKNLRDNLDQFKYIKPEKNPTLSKNNFINTNNWFRSHGNHLSNRFSELELINKHNIKNLEIAWTYNSGEPQDIQCNPIVINGIIYTPISGNYIAAIDGYNGKLIFASYALPIHVAVKRLAEINAVN